LVGILRRRCDNRVTGGGVLAAAAGEEEEEQHRACRCFPHARKVSPN
jgi:hypothetical protein